jgi:hypothetical protein
MARDLMFILTFTVWAFSTICSAQTTETSKVDGATSHISREKSDKWYQNTLNDKVITHHRLKRAENCTKKSKVGLSKQRQVSKNTTENLSSNSCVTYKDFPEYQYYRKFVRSAHYFTDIPGFVFNFLTIITVYNTRRIHITETYIIALAYADSVTVATRFLSKILENNAKTIDTNLCKLMLYIETTTKIFSNLILVAWSVERLIAILFPTKCVCLRSKRNTKRIFCFLLLSCSIISIPYLTQDAETFDKMDLTDQSICSKSEFIKAVWFHIESVYFIHIPVILVSFCIALIYYRLRNMPRPRIINYNTTTLIVKQWKYNRKMTILFVYIGATFVILHVPYGVSTAVGYMYSHQLGFVRDEPQKYAVHLFFTSICYSLTHFQDSVNFCILYMFWTNFKSSFLFLFCTKQTRPSEIEMSAV